MLALLLLCALSMQDGARELVEKLRSENLEEREEASAKLKKIGTGAIVELEKAAQDPDRDFAARVRGLIETIRIAGSLTDALKSALPGIEERLSPTDDASWTRAFLEATARDKEGRRVLPGLKATDLDPLVARALRGAA